ncbi:L-amino-acid oxidase-like [Erythrolamprus reginae]|uniref:L-amino-acid oxidase-like n=1 Tax=Erythrolamprus reginae TaxID=121349 RepID=UPI00396CC26D
MHRCDEIYTVPVCRPPLPHTCNSTLGSEMPDPPRCAGPDPGSLNPQLAILSLIPLLTATWVSKNHANEQEDWRKCFEDPNYEELLNIARNGLEKTSKPKTIVIVGAGISGLTAAKLMKDAGHQVHVLEASDRVGGRIKTHREKDWYVELGAMRIPKAHRICHEYIKKFSLPLNPFVVSNKNAWYLFRNRRESVAAVDENPNVFGYPMHPSELGKSAEELYKSVLDRTTKNCTRLKMKYDSYSTKEYLIKEGNLSSGAVEMIGDFLNEDAGYYLSFFSSVLGYIAFSDEDGFEEITGGFDQLPNRFYQEMSKIIHLNSRVEKIVRSSKKVKVFFHKDEVEDDSSFLIADYVLVTATAKTTRLIQFQPPLSHLKAHALRSLHYTSATKIALACTDKFWEREGIRGGKSITDLPTRLVYYPSHDFPGGLGVLLVSYTLHDDADFFAPLSDEECLDVVMGDISKIHNISKNYLESVCSRHVIHKWALDKFFMGAFAFPTPYQYSFFLKALFQNEGRVYFAGEHTTYPFGWIESAMKSAIRAASSIHLSARKFISQELKGSAW